jgi:hypothetical protein
MRASAVRFAFSLMVLAAIAPLDVGCSSTDTPDPGAQTGGSKAVFDPDADFSKEGAFFDLPYPSDARLDAKGAPELAAYPNPSLAIIDQFKKVAVERKGFPVLSIGYFRFDKPLETRDANVALPGEKSQSILLVDIDEKSPEKGRFLPVVASTPAPDGYVPSYLLAVSPRPGVLLAPSRKYAFVVRTQVKDAEGRPLQPSDGLSKLAKGQSPGGSKGDALVGLYAPLFSALDAAGIPRGEVAAATVFTTGDMVADTAELTKKLVDKYPGEVKSFALEENPALSAAPFCHVTAKISLPQFQKGKPPFDTEGLFEFGADGLPVKQRDEDVSVSITLPKKEMPAAGYPLIVFFHGSGGLARELVDGGTKGDPYEVWPGATVAKLGFAMAGSSLPISPERVPGAKDYDYLNLNNTPAMRDTFRQGIFESRVLIAALAKTEIPKSVVDACAGPSLPSGATAYKLDETRLSVQGQSMGGMYTNMVSAVEPKIEAAVPTGAGGYWTYFALRTTVLPNAYNLLRLLIGTREEITFMHPALHLIETAWEAIDPIVSTQRLAKRPLPGHPVRSIYEPAGKGDSYFDTNIYDAMALAYQHPQAGDTIWPTMKSSLDLLGIGEKATYPVKLNVKSDDGKPYTGIVVQYDNDNGAFDGHGIYRRVEAVRYQYGCFHASYRKNGVAVVPAPAPLGTPCPD